MKYNKGFAPVVILLIVLGVLAVGGVAYFAGTKNNPTSKNENTGICGPGGIFCKDNNNPPTDQNPPSKNPPVSTNSKVTTPTTQKDYKTLCNGDSVCQKYFDVWKKEQFSRNGYNESYFNEHIIPESMTINKWNSGESFYVIYTINIDWASIKTADSFLVKLSPSEDTYQYLNIPKSTYLDENNINVVINKLAFNSTFTFFKPIDHLYYKTKNDVLNAISTKAGNGFEFSEIRYISDRPKIENPISVPVLTASNNANCSQNKRRVASVNLITGEITISDSVCYMN